MNSEVTYVVPQQPECETNDEPTRHSGSGPREPRSLFAAGPQLSFAAASSQFNALMQFGSSERAQTLSIKERAQVIAQRRAASEEIFLREGIIKVDSNGLHAGLAEYLRAVESIRAKAAVLGYGEESRSVPITAVPGGYVGRFGGNDIYAAR